MISKPIIVLASLFLSLSPMRAQTQSLILYVSPQGNDAAAGTIDAPFCTFGRAAEQVAAIRSKAPGTTVTVYFRGGEYNLPEKICLGPEHGGSAEAPVVYAAYPGEEPLFYGSVAVKGWKKLKDVSVLKRISREARPSVLEADLSDAPIADYGDPINQGNRPELFCDGIPQVLARWPNNSFAYGGRALGRTIIPPVANGNSGAREGIFEYKDERIDLWAKEQEPCVYGYWFWDWDDSYQVIDSLDVRRNIMYVPVTKEYRHGLRFYGVNLISELDSASEWYLDRVKAKVYWIPPEGTDHVAGNADVRLSTLSKGPMISLTNCENTVIEGLSFLQTRGDGIRITGGFGCSVLNCAIRGIACDGIVVKGGKNHRISGCMLQYIGGTGISLTGGDRASLMPAGFEVSDTYISDFSRFKRTYQPGIGAAGCGMYIHHNEITRAPSSAFSFGCNDIVAEYNYIHDVCTESDDQGGFDLYQNASIRGIQLRYNLWRNLQGGTRYGVGAIRLDDLISGVRIYGNVFDSCGSIEFGAVQIHGGSENVVEDNLIYNGNFAVSFTHYAQKQWREAIDEIRDLLYGEVNIDSDLYRERYPELHEFGKNINVNIVRNNLLVDCERRFFNDFGKAISSNNQMISSEGHPVEYFCSAEFLNPLGVRAIPIDMMGIRNNKWINR